MFMKIDMQGDKFIVINLGQDLAHSNDLVAMFENNAKFVQIGYQTLSYVEPTITIELGESVTFEEKYGDGKKLTITGTKDAPVGYVKADNHGFLAIKELEDKHKINLEKKALENKQLSAQIEVLKAEIYNLQHPDED